MLSALIDRDLPPPASHGSCPSPRLPSAPAVRLPRVRLTRLLLLLTRAAAVGLSILSSSGCKGGPIDPPGAAPSPQASAEPAPFANPPSAPATAHTGADAGPPPDPMRSDVALLPDVPRELAAHDAGGRDTREVGGYAMQAVLRSGEAPAALHAPEVNVAAIDAARRRSETRMAIEVSPTRARFMLTGGAFVLPAGTELRARLDRYGHLLLWPGEDNYRVAEPGALRALLGERRLDVAPVARAEVVNGGEGPRRLNLRTRRVEVSTRAAKATLDVATLHDIDDGGVLVCRMLLDLMSASPATAACDNDEVPLHAELRWTTQGSLAFDVTSILRRSDLVAQDLETPPASLDFVPSPPPLADAETLASRSELAAFRTGPVDVPAAPLREGQDATGLTLLNSTDELRVVWIDGVPAAWVGPGARLVLSSLLRGRYVVQWRTFLGDAWEPSASIVVPGMTEAGHAPTP
jgi:hypothetical protein